MEKRFHVFVDGSPTALAYTFSALPRIGEWIAISEEGEAVSLIVEQVEHVAAGAFPGEATAFTKIHAKSRKI